MFGLRRRPSQGPERVSPPRDVQHVDRIERTRDNVPQWTELSGWRPTGQPLSDRPHKRRIEREAPTSHPDHVEARGLQLPRELEPRVIANVTDWNLRWPHTT